MTSKRHTLIGFAAVVLLTLGRVAQADGPSISVERLDATVVEGNFVDAVDGVLRLTTQAGSSETISIDDVASIQVSAANSTSSQRSDVARVHFAGGGDAIGDVQGIEQASVRMTLDRLGELDAPLSRLAGIEFAPVEASGPAGELFLAALSDRPVGNDVLVSRAPDVRALPGTLISLHRHEGVFKFGERERTFSFDKIAGVVLARGASSTESPAARITLVNGDMVPADSMALRTGGIEASLFGSVNRTIDWNEIRAIDFHTNRIVYLSDLKPTRVVHESRLIRGQSVQFDRTAVGGPIMLDGRYYDKGIGAHSYSSLTYKLTESFEKFVARIGIDDSVRPRGSVVFRVEGDGSELYQSNVLTGHAESEHVVLSISGVSELTLIVDYGDELDLADRANWAAARLIRPVSKETITN